MHLLTNILLFPVLTFLLAYCPGPNDYKYKIGKFPEIPTNLSRVNSEFDDYNSAVPPSYSHTFPLCFSSNRNSQGENFDIVYKLVTFEWSTYDGQLDVYEITSDNKAIYSFNPTLKDALPLVNSESNEMGPLLIFMDSKLNEAHTDQWNTYLFLYSSDAGGNQEIYFTHNLDDKQWVSPISLDGLNTQFNDCYPAWDENFNRIYISSDREQNYDIYYAEIENPDDVTTALLRSSELSFEKDTILSSPANDICPNLFWRYLVFASDMKGGFGGYDLYYSLYVDGNWSEPQNLGDKINTKYNEFRPVLKPHSEFSNDLMIFSSDRPGGMGGYDLYYVGIDLL